MDAMYGRVMYMPCIGFIDDRAGRAADRAQASYYWWLQTCDVYERRRASWH